MESDMPLSKVKVIELGILPAAAFCGRMFADFGADVLKVEPSDGDPGRQTAPLVDAGEGRRESAYFSYLNVRKRSVIFAQAAVQGTPPAGLSELLDQADVLIDSLSPDERLAMGVDHQALRASNPRLVILGMSWFGEDGPYRDFAGTDAICRALAGATHLVGPQEGPPTPAPDYQASNVAGLTAFIAAMAGLQRQGRGSYRFELSVLESAITLTDYDIALSWAAGRRDQRLGNNRFFPNYPLGIYPCKQGWIGVTVVTPVQWRTFCHLLGIEDLATDPRYVERNGRLAASDELEARFKPAFLEKTADEWFALAIKHMIPMVVVPQMPDLLADEEHQRRQVFERLNIGAHSYLSPANPLRLSATPPARNGRVPSAGEDSAHWKHPQPERAAPAPASADTPPPLQGIRIVDLSMGWAGPLATRHFADLGADVIKIEACQYPDWWRGVDDRPIVFEQRLYEKSAYFNVMNRNKRSITLDLTTPKGVELVKALIRKADIVIDNYSAGVLEKLGLGHDTLERLKPGLIMLSMPAFGTDGPWRNCRAYGSTLEQASGLPQVVGRPQDPPMLNHIAYGDPIGGLHAASALLVALHHARRSGQGQRIVLSQVECMLTMVAPWLIQAHATGEAPERHGDGHPSYAPHGSYQCRGEDAWVLIAVTGNDSWAALCEVIGRPDLAGSPALLSTEGRRTQGELLRDAIEKWTLTQTPDSAMTALQKNGVAAGASRLPTDLLQDPHLIERGFWKWIDRAHVGSHPQPSTGYREASLERVPMRPAPTLGESNTDVLQNMLGLSNQELDGLEAESIIGTAALPPEQRKSRAATGLLKSAQAQTNSNTSIHT